MCYRRRPAPARAPLPGARLLPLRKIAHALPARQARSRDTRERLIAAVELVIRERGLEGATVRVIAARAGLSVGAVYRRFTSKRALMRAAQERFLTNRAQRATATLRLARRNGRRGRPELALSLFLERALVSIERDRSLLLAFARAASSDAEIHGALAATIACVTGRPASADAIDLLLTALRGHVLDPAFPSGRGLPREIFTRCLAESHPSAPRTKGVRARGTRTPFPVTGLRSFSTTSPESGSAPAAAPA
jgi:AcrR family transcriptional regulator